ncbi:MAG TPA: trypsin-like peptidase domain-containing protein [Terracidiphilus sp.]|jgi:serine protease Do|nr:trypsin-like peptidase domain-containing protein [Terracidiphilus sp.]
MNSFLRRIKLNRLAPTFVVLTTLSAGIIIGSVAVHGVKGSDNQVNSSDATPLKIPNTVQLSTQFTQIAKDVGPAVVNIYTEQLPKERRTTRRRGPQSQSPLQPNNPQSPDDQQGPGDDDQQQGPDNNFQDFFNRFFGGPGGQGPEDGGGPDGGGVRESLGSGFLVDPRGYIITNNHVVDKADKIFVKLSTDPDNPTDHGRPAKVVGVDPDTDIALIKIDASGSLPTVKMGNSDSTQVGEWVVAIGEPFELAKTVTAGIISAKNRSIEPGAKGQFQHFIQTDAAINPGNSGGPLINMNGQVIGVNTAIYTQSAGYQGIGFAMPSNTVIQVYNDLIGPEHKVVRGSIGISYQQDLPAAVGRVYGFKSGVLVSSVAKGGPAEQAGIKTGDIINSVDGKPIKDGDDLVNIITARHPGSTAKIGYLRDGQQQSATVTITDRLKTAGALTGQNNAPNENGPGEEESGPDKLGVTAVNLPQQLTSKGVHGVLIQAVKPGSFADEIGLSQGAVINEINKTSISNKSDYSAAVSALKSGQDVVVSIIDPRRPGSGNFYRGGTLP